MDNELHMGLCTVKYAPQGFETCQVCHLRTMNIHTKFNGNQLLFFEIINY